MFFEPSNPEQFHDLLLLFCFETLGSITWSIQILFCILVSYVSVMFDYLKDNFQTILKVRNASQIETWRRNHVLVCQLVDNINDCFGVVLLISIGCYFVSFIVVFYELPFHLKGFLKGDSVPLGYIFHLIVMIFRDVIHFSLLVAMSYRMRRNVKLFVIFNETIFNLCFCKHI